MAYYPEQTHMIPVATILRDRMLPIDGEVEAQYGQTVAASDTVARALQSTERVIVDVSAELGLTAEAVVDLIQVEIEDMVEPGKTLADMNRRHESQAGSTA